MANKYKKSASSLSTDLFGLNFSCPIGAGSGYDTNASKYNSLSPCSFVESGPFYPCEPPNLDHLSFLKRRKAKKSALPSVKTAIARIQSHPPKSLILANIAPLPTHIECSAVTEDLLTSFTLLYDFVDMFVIDTFRKTMTASLPCKALNSCPRLSTRYSICGSVMKRTKPFSFVLRMISPISPFPDFWII